MVSARSRFTAVVAATIPMVLMATSATAATVSTSSGCSTSSATAAVTFGVADDSTPYGTLRVAQGTGEGAFTDTPAMTVRLRDGAGRVVATKSSTDGGMNLSFWRRIGGANWTAEATFDTVAPSACTTTRVRIATL